ncbi:GRIP domain-containing protein Rud3p [Diutina catenulata]
MDISTDPNGTTPSTESMAEELMQEVADTAIHTQDESEATPAGNGTVESSPTPEGDLAALVHKLQLDVANAEQERDEAKASYDTLVGKVSSMKSVFTKMKSAQQQLEETQEALASLSDENQSLTDELHQLKTALDSANTELASVRDQNELLNTECDKLSAQRKTYEQQIDALNDEKYILENQSGDHQKKIGDVRRELEQTHVELRESQQKGVELQARIDNLESSSATAEATASDWQRKYEDLKRELAERTDDNKHYQSQLDDQIKELKVTIEDREGKIKELESAATERENRITELESANTEIDKLKAEVHNKQLQIGKLRHEAIILNEHLTKSLTTLKQQSGDDSNKVDKELISNLLIQFLQFPRGDPKKFESLQLISGMLSWDETQRVSAGLASGNSGNAGGSRVKQGFVGLWTEFLEKESNKR